VLGSLLAIGAAGALLHRVGARRLSAVSFVIAWVSLALVGSTIAAGNLTLTCLLLLLLGAPGGVIVDAIGRYQTVLTSCILTAAGLALFMVSGGSALGTCGPRDVGDRPGARLPDECGVDGR
jgi:hypothetical protein